MSRDRRHPWGPGICRIEPAQAGYLGRNGKSGPIGRMESGRGCYDLRAMAPACNARAMKQGAPKWPPKRKPGNAFVETIKTIV